MSARTFWRPKFKTRFAGGCDRARLGLMSLAISDFLDCGRAEDMRLGDPILVCLGVLARGGGKRGVLRMFNVSSTSGAEPVGNSWLVSLRLPDKVAILFAALYSLSCNCIALELEVPCAIFSGDMGDEKMPDMGSMPCSSRTPVSMRTIPVLLPQHQHQSLVSHFCADPTHRPTLPTSKYWFPVRPRRPGVLRPRLFLASCDELAADMLRG